MSNTSTAGGPANNSNNNTSSNPNYLSQNDSYNSQQTDSTSNQTANGSNASSSNNGGGYESGLGMNNDDVDYDSNDDETSPYQHSNMDPSQAYSLMQQHGPLRHIPTTAVDQLELSEEVESLVSRDVIKRCIRKAKHRGNFAANLAAELFSKEERISCNCTGTRGKRQLSPRRLQIVKEITFRMYNGSALQAAALSGGNSAAAALIQDFEEAWRKECITAIDAKNRSIGRDIIKNTPQSSSSMEKSLMYDGSSTQSNNLPAGLNESPLSIQKNSGPESID